MLLLKVRRFPQLRTHSHKAKCPEKEEEPAQIQCDKPPSSCKLDDEPCPLKTAQRQQVCHTPTSYLVYKVLSLLLGFPLLITATYVLTKSEEPEDDEPPPPTIKYSYMGRITKKFPWGDGITPWFSKVKEEPLED